MYRGTIEIPLDGFGRITATSEVTVRVATPTAGEFEVQNLGGSGSIVVEFQGQVSDVQPGQSVTFFDGFQAEEGVGKIVVNNDEWTLSDEAETLQGHPFFPDAHNFALNIATWFTAGRPGNFLVYSSNFGLTGRKLTAAMTGAGHSWTVDPGLPVTLSTLQQFDAVFLALPPSVDNQVLIDYVRGGGECVCRGRHRFRRKPAR